MKKEREILDCSCPRPQTYSPLCDAHKKHAASGYGDGALGHTPEDANAILDGLVALRGKRRP